MLSVSDDAPEEMLWLESQLAEAEGPPLPNPSPQSLWSSLTEAAAMHSSRPALVSLQQPSNLLPMVNMSFGPVVNRLSWSYKQLREGADLLAACLYDRGIRSGMSVAVFLHNCAEWVLIFWACARLRAIFVPLDPRSLTRKDEVKHYLSVTRPSVLIASDEAMASELQLNHESELGYIVLKLIAESPSRCSVTAQPGWLSLIDLLSDSVNVYARTHATAEIESGVDPENDEVLIVFTSGTSGLPKACVHTSKNIWAMSMGASHFQDVDPTDSLIQHLPGSHILACLAIIACWRAGATVVIPGKFFNPATTLSAIDTEHSAHVLVVPSLLMALISHPSFHSTNKRSIKQITFGGAVVSLEIIHTARHIFGTHVSVGYGMSEGVPILGYLTHEEPVFDHGYTSVGRTAPGALVKICAAGMRQCLKQGEVGELHISGDMVINEYKYGNNDVFYCDERGRKWLATGDQARMDASKAVYILGRYKDLIIRGGENLSPALIEASLTKVSGVEAQIVGIPDTIAGELPIAVVRFQGAGPLPARTMQELVTEELGPLYAPAAYLGLCDLGLESFPTTSSGKVRKDLLKQRVLQHIQEKDRLHSSKFPEATTSEEDVLTRILSYLLGQAPDTFPQERPIHELADSINIMRLLALVKEEFSLELSIQDVLEASSIRDLADRLKSSSKRSLPGTEVPFARTRSGPPTVSNMVHAHGDESGALKTKDITERTLRLMDMGWQDVEDVFPVSGISMKHLGNTRALASTLRVSFVARTADTARCRQAIEASLQQWPLLRSVSVMYDESMRLFVVLRMESNWSKLAILDHPDVDSPADLCKLTFSPQEMSVRAPGPLIRIIIARVKSTDTAGVVLLINHAVQDAIAMTGWHENVERLLANKATKIQPRTPYKLFADVYYQYKTSLPAQLGVAFHVKRLIGISSAKDAIWPSQRCPGWFIGDEEAWQPSNLEHGFQTESSSDGRKQLDDGGWRIGYDGITQFIHIDHVAELWSSHAISVPVLFKTACALLNSHLTGRSSALFANSQAGRQWPFVDESMARYLPNPFNIAGPTFTVLLNRISVNWNETVGTLLCRLEAEQRHMTHHSHSPMPLVLNELDKPDSDTVMEATRPLLNWQPNWRGEATRTAASELEAVQVEGHADRGVIWHCGMMDGKTARLTAQWDGAQLAKREMEIYVDAFLKWLKWLHEPENWDRRVYRRTPKRHMPHRRLLHRSSVYVE